MNWSKFFFAMAAIFIAPHVAPWVAIGFGAFYFAMGIFAMRDEVKQ